MKKCLCLLLVLCMMTAAVLSVLPALAQGESELENVALGCSYFGSAPLQLDDQKNDPSKYSYKTGKELTDGIIGTTSGGSEWFVMWKSASYTLTVDLGEVKGKLAKVSAAFGYMNWGDKLPSAVKVLASSDDQSYTELGDLVNVTGAMSSPGVYDFELTLPADTSARYIRLEIKPNGGAFVFLSEIAVYAGYVSSFSFSDNREFIEDGMVYGFGAETEIASLGDAVNSMMGVSVLDRDGNAKTSGNFCTGDRIVKTDENGGKTEYTVIIDGDTDGNGKITAVDYLLLKRHVLETLELSGAYLEAADCDHDGKIGIVDYVLVKKHVLETYDLYEKYIPDPYKDVIMSYEIPENFNDKYTDPFGDTAFEQMEVEFKSNTYFITYRYPTGATWTVSFVRKQWGVWMFGMMRYTDEKGKVVQIMDASTDYEWVMQCGGSRNTITFRGGNHGDYANGKYDPKNDATVNDHFMDLTFYDAKTGKKVTLKEGEKTTVDGLRLVEHTNIYDNGGYDKSTVLINVEKIYLFNGTRVQLTSNLHLAKDTYFGQQSYGCMMPIYKQYGNYIKFYNVDGTTAIAKTDLVGKLQYGNSWTKSYNADHVELWGENNPAYHMDVQIYNRDVQMHNSFYKTRVWDMNSSSNKLYFAMFTGTEMFEKGTDWQFRSSWTFSYQPDFKNPTRVDDVVIPNG